MNSPGGSLVAVAMTSPGSTKAQMGSNIILAGIILQTIWFVFFVAGAAWFHYRMRAYPNSMVLTSPDIHWQQYLGSLYLVSGLVIVRSLFRLAEFAEGYEGSIQRNEAPFYIFDSLMMLILMVWMNWRHPSDIVLLLRKYDAKIRGFHGGEDGGLRVLS
jgi:hypothetical protein